MSKMIAILCSIFLCVGVFAAVAFVEAKVCDEIAWITKGKSLSLSSTEEKSNKCELMYIVKGDIDEVFSSIRTGFVERGWKITEDANVSVAGIETRALKCTHEGMVVEVATKKESSETKLAVELRTSGSSIKKGEDDTEAGRLTVEKEESGSGQKMNMTSMVKNLPIPQGASLISKVQEEDEYTVTYNYQGDLKEASTWVKERLEKQGWKVKKDASTETGFALNITIEARMDDFDLEVNFSGTMGISTIVYELSE